MFRADLVDYKGSAMNVVTLLQALINVKQHYYSETILFSNAPPQKGEFNRQIWKRLETAIRGLCAKPNVLKPTSSVIPFFILFTL